MKKKLLLVLIAVTSWGAWGQVSFQTFKTETGCKIFSTSKIDLPPYKWTGSCEDGFASGVGVYSFGLTSTESDGLAYIKSLRLNGKESGVRWYVYQAKMLNNNPSDPQIIIAISVDGQVGPRKRFSTDITLDRALLSANALFDEALQQNLPSMSRDQFLSDIKRWHQNPMQFATNAGGDSGANTPARSTQPDDPKVFGRSARGG